MSTASLEALVLGQKALIAALDADDATAIAAHTAQMDDALVRIRATGALFASDEAQRLVQEAIALADTARSRINVLADMTARRLSRLAAATGKGVAAPTYGRTGRLGR